jgi:broad specificity phosphatase PhoE
VRLYIIPSGDTVEERRGLVLGNLSGRLTDDAVAKIHRASSELHYCKLTGIATSTQRHHLTLGNILHRHTDAPEECFEKLDDRSMGALHLESRAGKFREIIREAELDPLYQPRDGGSIIVTACNISSWLYSVYSAQPHARIAVITGETAAKCLIASALGHRAIRSDSSLKPYSITTIEYNPPSVSQLLKYDSDRHLRAA